MDKRRIIIHKTEEEHKRFDQKMFNKIILQQALYAAALAQQRWCINYCSKEVKSIFTTYDFSAS